MNLKPEQIDALTELINIGVGRAAGVLNQMLHHHITLEVPNIKVLSHQELRQGLNGLDQGTVSTVRMDFKGAFSGTTALVFPPASAAHLAAILSQEDPENSDLDSVRIGALTEVGNIVINGVMGSITNVLTQYVSYSMPLYLEDTIENLLISHCSDSGSVVLVAQTRFTIEHLQIEGDIILLFESSFDALLAAIDRVQDQHLE